MLLELINLIRISHWTKNTFVFIPLLFAQKIYDTEKLITTLLLFVLFSLVSSSVYIFNDIWDSEDDKKHPAKMYRPVASGRISRTNAYVIFGILTIINLAFIQYFNFHTALILGIYFFINILYTIKLKEIVIVDIMIISLGFLLRILAGAFVVDITVSKWLILTTLFLSLFLAANKRKAEMANTDNALSSRKVLNYYDNSLIDKFVTISAGGLIICYALYTVADRTVTIFKTENLIFTTIFVIFGVFRYLFVTNNKKLENPVEVLLKDLPTLINIMIYFITVYIIIY